MAQTQRVTTTALDSGVVHVQLNRPDKRNGLDRDLFVQLVQTGEQLITRPGLRAVVLSGAGKVFCAGLDFLSFMSAGPAAREELLQRDPQRSPANLAQRVGWVWQEVPVPVIAAVHGVAYGGGLQIALGADIRLVAADARLSVMELEYGLIPDMSITQTLLRLVPLDVAKELVFTARIVDGQEAVRLGLATRVAQDPLQEALELARQIAARSPEAIRAAKALLNRAPELSTAEALKLETELQLPLLGSRNQLEAVQARFQKRPPVFTDPGD